MRNYTLLGSHSRKNSGNSKINMASKYFTSTRNKKVYKTQTHVFEFPKTSVL